MDAYTGYWRDRVCGLFGCNSINMNDYDDEQSALAHQQELEHQEQEYEQHRKSTKPYTVQIERAKRPIQQLWKISLSKLRGYIRGIKAAS